MSLSVPRSGPDHHAEKGQCDHSGDSRHRGPRVQWSSDGFGNRQDPLGDRSRALHGRGGICRHRRSVASSACRSPNPRWRFGTRRVGSGRFAHLSRPSNRRSGSAYQAPARRLNRQIRYGASWRRGDGRACGLRAGIDVFFHGWGRGCSLAGFPGCRCVLQPHGLHIGSQGRNV